MTFYRRLLPLGLDISKMPHLRFMPYKKLFWVWGAKILNTGLTGENTSEQILFFKIRAKMWLYQ